MLYVIAGNGTGNQKEIEASLADLMAKAVEAQQEFWFAIQPGDDATSKYILKWIKANEVYFDSIGTKIPGAAEQRDADAIVEFMQEFESEGVELLALFVDVDDEVEEDAALMALVEEAVGADFTVRMLNSQMTKLVFGEDGGEAVEEETTGTIAEAEDDEEQVEEQAEFTEADLKKMTVPELVAMAKGQGLDVKSLGRSKPVLIAAILEAQEAPLEEAEIEEIEEAEALEAALEKDEAYEPPAPKRGKAAANGKTSPLEDTIKDILRAVGKALIDASK